MGVPAKMPLRASKSQAIDDLIMGTNSSSIVSKRSVERFYYPNEPHFFRYFVNKFQRRAPLINRGYWLRLKAIDVVVRQFLAAKSTGRKKVVINLGCGSDVLPWQCHTRYPKDCENTVFVDVDYPDLILKKRAIVLGTPQLRDLLGPDPVVSEKETDQILLRSDKYCQLGCDLRQLDIFKKTLESFLDLSDCDVLFVAEVSITYMDTASADALIHWASSIGKAEFCLLEQILPNGPHHPFAKTMLSHFDKLNTSLKSVHQYPTIESQHKRFHEKNWQQVEIWDLWDAWNSDAFLTSAERVALDQVEPFDEWEEFILFARHYTVVHATAIGDITIQKQPVAEPVHETVRLNVSRDESQSLPRRRFGAPMSISNFEGQRYGINTMGMGTNGRLPSLDVYSLGGSDQPLNLASNGPSARMCHTLTDLGNFGILLAGGRGSPTSVFSDCWLFKKDSKSWHKTFDLPTPLFRHSALSLEGSSMALVQGGKTGSPEVSPDYILFHPVRGWLRCAVSGDAPQPTFGAVFTQSHLAGSRTGSYEGLLCGGISKEGTINTQVYRWQLATTESQPIITFNLYEGSDKLSPVLSVFGAQTIDLKHCTAICGGVGQQADLQGQDLTILSTNCEDYKLVHAAPSEDTCSDWPLIIGSSVVFSDGYLHIFGGGATCFSMGTYWNNSVYTIDGSCHLNTGSPHNLVANDRVNIKLVESPKIVPFGDPAAQATLPHAKAIVTPILKANWNSFGSFEEVLRNRKPVVVTGLNIGDCVDKWTPSYMAERLGEEKEVIVHECQAGIEKMDFNSKNFRYVTETFKSFLQRAEAGGPLYMRSLSQEKPSEAPANVSDDFPSIAQDMQIPEELHFIKENLFSSILRISGRVNMWLHYDVMANIYMQIRGSKRMILFPPKDVPQLGFAPGASSSSLDVFSTLESPELAATHPYEAILEPGDVLFLPAMWLHTAMPTTDMSVAVNIFFRDLESGYSAGRDVYGNRDLAAYEKGRQDVAKIAKAFDKLPEDIRQFYLARLGEELMRYERN